MNPHEAEDSYSLVTPQGESIVLELKSPGQPPYVKVFSVQALTSLILSLVESLPVGTNVDFNLRVPLTSLNIDAATVKPREVH